MNKKLIKLMIVLIIFALSLGSGLLKFNHSQPVRAASTVTVTQVITTQADFEQGTITPYLSTSDDPGSVGYMKIPNPLWYREIDYSGATAAAPGLALATFNNQIYAFGGGGFSGDYYPGYPSYTASNKYTTVYDPIAKTWTRKANMSIPKSNLGAATANGKIYVIGGETVTNSGWDGPTFTWNNNDAYDPVANTWAAVAPMPTARKGLAVVESGGKIYAIGGAKYNGDGTATYYNNVEVYDPLTDSWTNATPMTTAREYFGAANIGGKIYIVGGDNSTSTAIATGEVYDPSTNTWTPIANLNLARSGCASTNYNGKLVILGGSANGRTINDNLYAGEQYDPQTNVWTALTGGAGSVRTNGAAATVGSRYFYIGGTDDSGQNSGDNQSYPNIEYTYNSTAQDWQSGAFQVDGTAGIQKWVSWQVNDYDANTGTPCGSSGKITYSIRFSADGVNWGSWVINNKNVLGGVNGLTSYNSPPERYLQIKAHFDGNCSSKIKLYDITIIYQRLSSSHDPSPATVVDAYDNYDATQCQNIIANMIVTDSLTYITITNVDPNHLSSNFNGDLTLTGKNLDLMTDARLVRNGYSDIVGVIKNKSSGTAVVTFTLNGAANGSWDGKFTNNLNQITTKKNLLQVTGN